MHRIVVFYCVCYTYIINKDYERWYIMARKNDTGVFQLDSGNWAYRIYMSKDAQGNKVDTTCRKDENGNPFKTKKAAVDARTQKIVELKTPTKKKTQEDVTISEVWEEYLKTESKGKAYATITKHSSLWKNHIKERFGNTKLSELTINDIETFLQELYDSGLSFAYVESFIKFFFLIGGIAYRKEWIDTEKYVRMFQNKSTKIRMPKITQEDLEDEFEVESYELYQISQIEQIFKKGINDTRHGNLYTAFLLGYYLGVRISECFGLMWTDIRWESKTIKINKQMVYENGVFCLKPVKTLTSVREIDIPDTLYHYLSQQFHDYCRISQADAYKYKATEIVLDKTKKGQETPIQGGKFINRKASGELLTINSMKYWAKKIKEETGIDFKYHSLRKTHLTQLAEMNTPVVETMKRAGHKKYDTTMRYYVNTTTETKLRLLNNINSITTEEPTITVDLGNGETKEMKQSEYLKFRQFAESVPSGQ